MRTVKVNKQELLKILRANRLSHQKAYKEALDDRLQAGRAKLYALLSDIDGDKDSLDEIVHFPKPRCYTKNYDEIIKMMEMEVEDQVSLTQDEFSKYVLDEWHWKIEFDTITARYK